MQAIKYFIVAEISDISLKSPIVADFSTKQIEQQDCKHSRTCATTRTASVQSQQMQTSKPANQNCKNQAIQSVEIKGEKQHYSP